MHLEYIFFVIYILGCFYVFPRVGFIKRAGLTPTEVRLLLAFKLIVAIICSFYFAEVLPYSDSKTYNMGGLEQYQLLLNNPGLFFTNSGAGSATYGLGGVFDASNSFWADLRFTMLHKIIALFNLITAGHFYLNSLVFSSLLFFGHIAFYRIYNDLYPGNKIIVVMLCFLLPSVLTYTACVHKDGLVFFFIGLISFIFYSYLQHKKRFSFTISLVFICSMLGIFVFRNYVLLALLPAMFTAWLCSKRSFSRWLITGVSYIAYAVIFFLAQHVYPSLHFADAVVKRRAEFAAAGPGSTDLGMQALYPTASSFLVNTPNAVNHVLFRPYLWEFSGLGVLLAALELACYQSITLLFIFFRRRQYPVLSNYNLYALAFFATMVLIIGYTIPNVGAIVRYRGLIWIFVLVPMVCGIDWARLAFWQKKQR